MVTSSLGISKAFRTLSANLVPNSMDISSSFGMVLLGERGAMLFFAIAKLV